MTEKTLQDISLADLAPDSITRDKAVSDCITAIDPYLKLSNEMDYPAIYVRLGQMTGRQLDHLAVQYDATWRDSWPLSRKRRVIAMVIAQKRKVGTLHAVREALAAISSIATVTEWWQQEPKGTPHTFLITATLGVGIEVDEELQEDLMALIDNAKPLRSWYTLTIQRSLEGGLNIYGAARPVVLSRIPHI
jgi:phage tail P2-like protein